MKELIDQFSQLINNEAGQSIHPISHRVSVIDLALTTSKHGFLTLSKIPEEYLAPSDHEFILLR